MLGGVADNELTRVDAVGTHLGEIRTCSALRVYNQANFDCNCLEIQICFFRLFMLSKIRFRVLFSQKLALIGDGRDPGS